MAATFKRSGLHRLSCDSCPCYGYLTVATLESIGELPQCLSRSCKGTLQPERIELALMLDAVDAPIMRAYVAKCSSVAHGQAHTGRDASTLESPEFRALYGSKNEAGIVQTQRKQARARRIAAIMPTPEPMVF